VAGNLIAESVVFYNQGERSEVVRWPS